jgi:short-subunit dehydrogenase
MVMQMHEDHAENDFCARYGPWAVVTGASSGIGDAFARQLASARLDLVLVARRRDRLERLRDELCAAHGIEVRVVELDLAREVAAAELATAIADLDVGLFVSNAGFGLKGAFLEIPLEEQLRMLTLNCRFPLEILHRVVPRLRARGRGGIIVVGSTAAFQGIPGSATYSATKAFDLLLAEAVAEEVRADGVDVLALLPGPTDTEGPRRTGVDPYKAPVAPMQPDAVARAGLRALGRRPVVIPGFANRLTALILRLVPRAFATRQAGRLVRRVLVRDGDA